MKETDLQTVILYLLNNNRDALLEKLVEKLPNIVLTNFWPNIDNLDNDNLALYLTGFLRVGNNLAAANNLYIPYNVNANNYTVTEEIFNYIKQVNNDSSSVTLQEILTGGEPKSMEWLQSIGDFFGGSTEPETSTTTETTSKINPLVIMAILASLVGFAFMVFKFYRKSPVARS